MGIFDIQGKRYTVDVLMSASSEYSETRGIRKVKPLCQHSASGQYEGYFLPTVTNSLYDVVVNDVAEMVDDPGRRLMALTVAVENMASIASGKELSVKAKEIWDAEGFARYKVPFAEGQYTNLTPRIVIVSYEDNETDGSDD